MKNGKFNCGILSTVPAWGDGLMLQAIWQVNQDLAYQVNRHSANTTWIAIRTRSGQGRLTTTDQTEYRLEADTLLLLDNRRIRSYGTTAGHWKFVWFEFAAAFTPPLCQNAVLALSSDPYEKSTLKQIAALLRRQSPAGAAAASALLGWLLRWYALEIPGGSTGEKPRDRRIDQAVENMGRNLDAPLKITTLARRAGLCERAFRSLFEQETGCSPKQYYDRLRLSHAAEMLASGEYNVEQTAQHLGYSSAFHFSQAFKHHFGQPPSSYRPATVHDVHSSS